MKNETLIVETLVEIALDNYELSCGWSKSAVAAQEALLEEFGIKGRKTLVLHCVNLAKIKWNETVIKTKNLIEA